METKSWTDLLVQILSNLTMNEVFMSTILPLITGYIIKYIRIKNSRTKNKELRELLDHALTRLDKTSATVISEINQTLRDKMGGGKLTDSQKNELRRIAYKRIKERLPDDVWAVLNEQFADNVPGEKRVQRLIVGKIENKVAESKTCV